MISDQIGTALELIAAKSLPVDRDVCEWLRHDASHHYAFGALSAPGNGNVKYMSQEVARNEVEQEETSK